MALKLLTPAPRMAHLDEGNQATAKNGRVALGSHMKMLAGHLNAAQYNGRPLYCWWSSSVGTCSNSTMALRQSYLNVHSAATQVRGIVGYLQPAGSGTAAQGVALTLNSVEYDDSLTYSTAVTPVYPQGLVVAPFSTSANRDPSGKTIEMGVGSLGGLYNNGPLLTAGLVYENVQPWADPDPKYAVVDDEHESAGSLVVAQKTGTIEGIDRFRDRFIHAWRYKRPQIGWSADRCGLNYLSVASTDYRSLLDNTIGQNATPPSQTGLAITLPLWFSGSGRNNTVRVGVRFYAKNLTVSYKLDFAVSHLDTNGNMTAITSLGTGLDNSDWTWWPTLNNPPYYFDAPTNLAFDRIVLLARAYLPGLTAYVGAFTLTVEPA